MGIMRNDDFIDRLKKSDDYILFCKKEVEYLRANYLTIPTLKRAYSDYRKTIKESDLSVINKQTCIKPFSLTEEEYTEYKTDYKKKVISEHDNLQDFYNYKLYIQTAIDILNDSNNYHAKILSFSVLTGRRVQEIASTADFNYVSNHELSFKGQIKTRKLDRNLDSYTIPVLTDSNFIIDKFKEFRKEHTKYVSCDSRVFHNNNSKHLGIQARKYFRAFTKNDIKPSDLRAVYAEIASSMYKPANQTKQRYFALILGHNENDLNTCNSYFRFRLAS